LGCRPHLQDSKGSQQDRAGGRDNSVKREALASPRTSEVWVALQRWL
jgi:hypothetical protein